jgi:putative ABC transport system permease protein
MNLLETLRVAVRALWRNKTRSFLTTLGIIIGVASVIAMVAIGEGARAAVEKTFQAMGTNLLIVLPGSSQTSGAKGGFGSQASITWDDLKAIGTDIPSVRYAVPVEQVQVQIQSEDQNWSTRVMGSWPDYFAIRNWGMSRGRAYTMSDVEAANKVVVLGQTVVDKLFGPNSDPVGQMVRIRGVPFSVIGVADKKGQSPMGQDYDDAAFCPVSTFQTKIQGGLGQFVNGILYVGAVSESSTGKAQREIAALLRERHHLQDGVDDDFDIRNLSEIASAREEGSRTLSLLLLSIALVSLVVGGIGIMNIMLVSVTERTREIGLRMAIGARPRDILTQFLMEALALAVAGGLFGVVVGLFVAQRMTLQFHTPMTLHPSIIVGSVAFSGLVGVVFGLYPASKASRLDPIEALRYE